MRRIAVAVTATLLAGGGLGISGATAVEPDGASAESARRGAAYLAGIQNADGSVPPGARIDGVADAVVALVAGGGQDGAVDEALDYIAEGAHAFLDADATNGALIGRVVSGLVAAGEDPRAFAGIDWVEELESAYVEGGGRYDDTLYGEALGMLGRLAAGEDLPFADAQRLRSNQCSDGGWAWQTGCLADPDTDTTSLAMSVLAAAFGPDDADVRAARQWLLDTQLADDAGTRCWGLEEGQFDNANSCGLAISAVLALGEDPAAAPWSAGGDTPLAALREFQLDSGGFAYRITDTGANNSATIQAVPAQAHWSYPVSPPAPDPGPDPDPGPGGGDDDGGGEADDESDGRSPRRSDGSARGSPSDGVNRASGSSEDAAADPEAPPLVSGSRFERDATTTSSTEAGPRRVPVTADGRGGRDPGPAVATAILDGGGSDGDVGAVPTGVAAGSLTSALTGIGWYWRRRAVPAALSLGPPS